MTTKPTPSTGRAWTCEHTPVRATTFSGSYCDKCGVVLSPPQLVSTGDALPDALANEVRALAEDSNYSNEMIGIAVRNWFHRQPARVKADAPIAGELEELRAVAKMLGLRGFLADEDTVLKAADRIASLQADKVRKDEAVEAIERRISELRGDRRSQGFSTTADDRELDVLLRVRAALNPEQGEKL